jgi:hypothetical protein
MMADIRPKRTLFRHPLAAVGGALFAAGGALFFFLLLIEFSSHADNPYRSLVTFIAAPFVITVGFALFLLSIWLQVRAARRRGETVRFNLTIDPTDPRYRRNLALFLTLTAVLVVVVVYSGTKAYDATDSVAFCGQTCHTVMEPQYVTYHNSPHARVPCVECHIGPGASFWVRSKIDGTRQVIKTLLNTYERPIKTPIRNLRPAQQTCEECHWPNQFYGEKLVGQTYYRTDATNSPWTINLLVKIGGGNPHIGRQEGIHWHMIVSNKIDYIAADFKRQVIPWVRCITATGDTVIYTDPDTPPPDLNDPKIEVRRFDCIDCHNRPSHRFLPPAVALNLALSTRRISPRLPWVRKIGLDLLNAEYPDRDSAHSVIGAGLYAYYENTYPDIMAAATQRVDSAVTELLRIYDENFFPEMKTDYRARENNLSHFVNNGCFRCHDGNKRSTTGKTIPHDCTTCHLVVAQGPSEVADSLETRLSGLEFHHPEDIEDAWKDTRCTECHDPGSGY